MRGVAVPCNPPRKYHKFGSDLKCIHCQFDMQSEKPKLISTTRLYYCWSAFKARCLNPKAQAYRYYGARGITVCDEWRGSFAAFEAWAIANGFKPELQIDRIDNDKGYSPDNCRWVDRVTNSNNRRDTLKLPNGAIPSRISESLGLTKYAVSRRVREGMPVELAMSLPKFPHRKGIAWKHI